MGTVNRFEDLKIWQSARELSREIYRLSGREPFVRDFSLKNQIRAASGSVMDNIAEGFERSGNREFIQFLSISKGSCGEVQSQLYRALDQKYLSEEEFQLLYERARKINVGIANLITYLRDSGIKGQKFKESIVEYITKNMNE
ncbi:MAG: four helix bundle protein [Phaeodactylibacter sp.]|nr:four helix bundle protein [Phaeodactylibacter sp.]MCB9048607.1 four helix bundle protein [Lewinellaceae bacterium]